MQACVEWHPCLFYALKNDVLVITIAIHALQKLVASYIATLNLACPPFQLSNHISGTESSTFRLTFKDEKCM